MEARNFQMIILSILAGHKRGLKCGNFVSADPKSDHYGPKVAKATPTWGRAPLK